MARGALAWLLRRRFKAELFERRRVVCAAGRIENFDSDEPSLVVVIDDDTVRVSGQRTETLAAELAKPNMHFEFVNLFEASVTWFSLG
jgi:hypothetical protein